MRLDGAVALVTGGTAGIGEAIVRRFSEEGAAVAYCARTTSRGERLARELVGEGRNVAFLTCDVTDEGAVRRLLEAVLAQFGRLDILVNNAGTSVSGPVEGTSLEEWRRALDGNLTSTFLVSKHAIPALRRSGRGVIINLGSTYGFGGVRGSGAYAASKAAVINLTKTLALELAPDGIRVNALCPGATATPMNLEWTAAQPDPEGAQADLVSRHPIGRLALPREQADAAVFLASDESSYMTGHALLVDGGFTAAP